MMHGIDQETNPSNVNKNPNNPCCHPQNVTVFIIVVHYPNTVLTEVMVWYR